MKELCSSFLWTQMPHPLTPPLQDKEMPTWLRKEVESRRVSVMDGETHPYDEGERACPSKSIAWFIFRD